MKLWTVQGWDVSSGEPRRVVVKADDEQDAIHLALLQKIRAEKVSQGAASPVIAAETRASPLDYSGPQTTGSPAQDAITTDRRLRLADWVMTVLALLYFALGLVACFVCCYQSGGAWPGIAQGLLYLLYALAIGILLLGLGAALRVLGIIGKSITSRD